MRFHYPKLLSLAIAAGLAWAAPAQAAGCPSGTVCAADPQTVVSAMQEAGYKAKLTTLKESGDPMIESAANGYDFEVHFSNCTDKRDCQSLVFVISFNNDDGGNTMEMANKWNNGHRFSVMSFSDENQWLNVTHDVTTVGGLRKENMASLLQWWSFVLGDLRDFFDANPVPAKG